MFCKIKKVFTGAAGIYCTVVLSGFCFHSMLFLLDYFPRNMLLKIQSFFSSGNKIQKQYFCVVNSQNRRFIAQTVKKQEFSITVIFLTGLYPGKMIHHVILLLTG